MIACPPKEQLANDSTSKGNGVDISLCGRAGVLFFVERLEDGIDLADDSVKKVSGLLVQFVLSECIPI